jgi:signal transduction histidine kinase
MLSFATISQFVFFFIAAVFMGHLAQEAREKSRAKDAVEVALQESTDELKAAREVLRANDRLATLGMLSAGIAHEIKNPLAAITSSIQPGREILDDYEQAVASGQDGKEEAAELREVFDDCLVACKQLLRVAQDLSSVARGGSASMLPVDPAGSIETAARILKSRVKPPYEFIWEAKTTRTILADPGRVLQILLNLASNALDAMRSQGHGTLIVRAEDAGPFHIAFVVEDTGPGVPEDLHHRIFEPFFTTKGPGKGTGLGLHLVGEITRSLSGTIQLDPPTVGGARFRVELPVFIRRSTVEKFDEPRTEVHPDRGRRGAHPQGAEANVQARTL